MRRVTKRAFLAVPAFFAFLTAFTLATFQARADLEVTASVQIHAKTEFEVPLAPHGAWVEVGSYGRCWRPAHVSVEWRPYCSGEWVWTDCGWYWSSDEPWAWACYHYGSWVFDPAVGWVWVPGVEWAPAWVSWRVGGGYVGWAPLPPPGLFFVHHPEPELFVFVGTASFGGAVRPGALIVKNSAIVSHTTELGGIKRESRALGGTGSQKVLINHGPEPETIQKASGKAFAAVPIQDAMKRTTLRSQTLHGITESHSNHTNAKTDDRTPKSSDFDHGVDHSDSHGKDYSGASFGGADRGGHFGGHGRH